MKFAIFYESQTGNTHKIARAIKEVLPEEECVAFGMPDLVAAQRADLVFLGFWTDKGTCSESIRDFLKALHHRKLAVFGTAGFGGSKEYYERILKSVIDIAPQDNKLIDAWMCQGQMPQSVRNCYEEQIGKRDEPARDAFIRNILSNFDKAIGHPDAADVASAKEFAENVYAKATQK